MNVETALNKVKGHLDRLLDKNLTDLIRGIRNNRENEAKFISQCIDEIKIELKQENMAIKANAVAKLSYLQMIGYNINWAAFNIIEVMSSTKFTYKRIGYLAASQSFHPQTDVLMLTTNMIKKDINSSNQYEAAISLGGLACFITPELARDLSNDITSLMSSTKPYLRKRAILMMYKIFVNYPDALEHGFTKMKDKLEDQDQSVQSAAVNVICELARRNPKNYLSLAPIFFKLMTNSTNNWMLIKIIKLFGTLTPLEPRLGKKLLEPLTNLIHSTSAMSLLYECINTLLAVLVSISSGQPDHSSSVQLCLQKLRILIEDSDQNLKYLGLLAMGKILKTYPKNVQAHKDIVLRCLEDKDDSIRLRALHLLYGMVNKKNLADIVKTLLNHLSTTDCTQNYRDELMTNSIKVCSQGNYQFITDFEWYLGVLIEMSKLDTSKNGELIASQLLDVTIRVPTLRPFSVHQMENLVDNSHLFTFKGQNRGMSEVLYVAAFLCGEYSEFLKNPELTLQNMLEPRILALPAHVQSVFILNSLKVYARLLGKWLKEEPPSGQSIISDKDYDLPLDTGAVLIEKLGPFCQSQHVEVQERASETKQMIEFICKNKELCLSSQLLFQLFAGELRPVAAKAQKKVPLPPGLDLDEAINDNFNDATSSISSLASRTDATTHSADIFGLSASGTSGIQRYQLDDDYMNSDTSIPDALSSKGDTIITNVKKAGSRRAKDDQKNQDPSTEQLEKARLARIEERAHNPHYLKSSSSEKTHKKHAVVEVKNGIDGYANVSHIPVQILNLDNPLRTNGNGSGDFNHSSLVPNGRDQNIDVFDLINSDDMNTTRQPGSNHVVQILEPEMPEDALSSSSSAQSDQESHLVFGSSAPAETNRRKRHQQDRPLLERQSILPSELPVDNGVTKERKKEKGEKERKKKKHKVKDHKHDSRRRDETEKGDEVNKARHHKNHGATVLLDHIVDVPNVQDNLLISNVDIHEEPQIEGSNLINGFEELNQSTTPKLMSNGTNVELDDLDFWLSPTSQIPPTLPQTISSLNNTSHQPPVPESKKHHKKSKDKKSGSKNRSHQKQFEKKDDRQEEPLTSSQVDDVQAPLEFALAQNDHIRMTYTTKVGTTSMQKRQMLVTLTVSNVSPTCQLKNVELTILDCGDNSTLTMLRPPFTLASKDTFNTSNIPTTSKALTSSTCTLIATSFESTNTEPVSIGLLFGCETFASTATPQLRLRGCLSYLAKDFEKSTSEKLDFKATLPIHALMSPVPILNSDFVELLANHHPESPQVLRYSRDFNLSLPNPSHDQDDVARVNQIIHMLSSKFQFYVVERVGNLAISMYSKTILDQPICLLLKFFLAKGEVNILAKSVNQELVNALLTQEMQPFLLKHFATA